jgi:hypothetical protein
METIMKITLGEASAYGLARIEEVRTLMLAIAERVDFDAATAAAWCDGVNEIIDRGRTKFLARLDERFGR